MNEIISKQEEKRSRWKWLNPYINKIKELPEYILGLPAESVPEEALQALQAKCSGFKKIYLELGSGSGNHLVELAKSNPDALCIGIELRFKRVYKTAEKAKRLNLPNVYVIHTDARRIPQLFKHSGIDRVYVNFPDPWEKRAWDKHRLLNQAFLEVISNLLIEGGVLLYKTDHRKNFEQVLEISKNISTLTQTQLSFDLENSALRTTSIKTEFEGLFLSQGICICYVEFCRNSVKGL